MLNNVILVGRLTKDVELKELENDGAVVRITLAVQRGYKNAEGEKEVDFIEVTCWNETAKLVKEYSKKGDLIGIKGRLQNNNYEKEDGTKVYQTVVIAERVNFLKSAEVKVEE